MTFTNLEDLGNIDVIVVGAGKLASCAALSANENEARVIMLEPAVSPELSCRLIMLKNFGYRAMLLPYEPCTFFRDQFPDGRLPLPP